jgi:hypothetical protein|tara:strand:+ start:384 stop:620 length:237 start_codon:yes stop_codon:yes gene_type:complete
VDLSVFKPIDKRHARTQLGWHPTRHTILFGGDPAVPGKRFLLAKQVVDTLRDRGFDPISSALKGYALVTCLSISTPQM